MSQPALDPVSIAAGVASAMLGQQIAPYVGAYTVIVFAWVGGVLVGLYRRDPSSRMGAAAFVFVSFVLTLGMTTAAADQLAARVGADSTSLIFPVAFLIPAIGDSWGSIAQWVWTTYWRTVRGGK